jgi:hypothetical protein
MIPVKAVASNLDLAPFVTVFFLKNETFYIFKISPQFIPHAAAHGKRQVIGPI